MGDRITLSFIIQHDSTYELTGAGGGGNEWWYPMLDMAEGYELEIDGVSEKINITRWWIEEEDPTVIHYDNSLPHSWQGTGAKLTVTKDLRDVPLTSTIRVRAVGYRFPDDIYSYSAWTESQTLEEMLPAASTSPCLIATATYGSELTPQVQFLRTFRDERVLQTFAGRQFMHVFNSFYYSWSPNVADTIRTHDSIATVMQPILYPLIGILQLSEGIFSVLSFHPELAVIATGGVASALLAGIYLLPLTLLISYVRKRAVSRTLVSAMGIIWLASLCAIVLAELTQSTAVMMTATGTFVLATMIFTVLALMNLLPTFFRKTIAVITA